MRSDSPVMAETIGKIAGVEVGDARAAVGRNPLWYHTMEVAPGVATPGWFDLRGVVDRMPWPDVRGRRCLDVGTYDGFLAFELERRGAAEVVATDISDHTQWDHPVRTRRRAIEHLGAQAGTKGDGFAIARELLGSSVERVEISVYDLTPQAVGEFDVVVCGSLMLHLRDPLRALSAIHGVCRGLLLSSEELDFRLTRLLRRIPVARVDGTSDLGQWWVVNEAGHIRLIEAGGFDVVARSGMYFEPFGRGHPRVVPSPRRLVKRLVGFKPGVPHAAALARPAGPEPRP